MIDDIITKIRESYRIKLLEKELREERLIRKLSDEYEEFKKEELSKSKDEIFDDASRINFYFEVYNYFLECGELDEEVTKLLSSKDEPMSFLWDEYLSMDGASIGTWDDMDEFLINVRDDNVDQNMDMEEGRDAV